MGIKHVRKKIIPAALALSVCFAAAGCGTERSELEDAYAVYDMTSEYLDFGSPSFGYVETAELFAGDLCVGGIENSEPSPGSEGLAETAAVFVLDDQEITYAQNIYARRYPASTTKILTAYLALKYGDLDQSVTVSSTALYDIGYDSSVCGISVGDTLTLRDLLYGLMLESGNDAANVIAETISGSVTDFVDLMNREAEELGATQSHFVNPHGLPDDDHYTTAYDLYLIFSAAIENPEFVDIISTGSYTVRYQHADGTTVEEEWFNTNSYLAGTYAVPEGVTVVGGKTGTTDAAGSCLVLYSLNRDDSPVISIVLKGNSHAELYECMSDILANYAN